MGFYVKGNNPSSSAGLAFECSVWTWAPLAGVLEAIDPAINEKIPHLHTNDGSGLNAHGARQLGLQLLAGIADGSIQEHLDRQRAMRLAVPDEPCKYCETTGTITEAVARQFPSYKPHVGTKCFQCRGKGHRRPISDEFSVTLDEVRQFAEFCLNSGGFEIW